MADRYIYSAAAGTGTGASWANAHTTIAAAITASTGGDRFFVAHDHAESNAASVTYDIKGDSSNPDKFICANRAGSVPPISADVRTTATVTITGTNSLSLTRGNTTIGVSYWYGINFIVGSGAGAATIASNATFTHFDECTFQMPNTGGASYIQFIRVLTTGCQFYFGSTGNHTLRGDAMIATLNGKGKSFFMAGSSIPSTLFNIQSGSGNALVIKGYDLSAITGTFMPNWPWDAGTMQLINCKIASGVTIVSGNTSSVGYFSFDLINCSAAGVIRNERHHYGASMTTETTIVRTAGSNDDTTTFSAKIVSNAGNNRFAAFKGPEGILWNAVVGSARTLTVHIVTNNITLTDAEIWLEVEYLGTASSPSSSFISDGPADPLIAGANQAASTETWTTTGITPIKQKLDVTFTPLMAGPIKWTVKYAKAISTVYIDCKPDLT